MRNFAVVLLFALAGSTISTFAGAQPAGWAHRGGVRVLEKSGEALADHQVLVTIDTATLIANGQMNADGSDLRFFSDCAYSISLPYWIESGLGTAATKVWVRAPSLPANATTTIYFAHGNVGATAQSALSSVFDGVGGVPGTPISATNKVSHPNAGGVTSSQRGFRFAPKKDMIVVQVGKNEPNGSTRHVTIFDFATEAKLYQTQVSGPAAEYTYQDVAQPLWLDKAREYLLEMYQGDSDGYYFGAAPQVDSNITYLDMRYCNGCTKDTFPTQFLENIHYGYSDLMFFTRKDANPQPEQTAAVCENTPTCNADCSVASCGDGVINPAAGEECDDGNDIDTDACTNSCKPAVCGDGIVQAGVEACDDGNDIDTDACRNDCAAATCGDGIVQAGVEECDDGNDVDTDACRNNCLNAVCGDGVVQPGVEECDDGNQTSGDGCSATCTKEAVVDAGVEPGTGVDSGTTPETDAGTGAGSDAAEEGDGCSCRVTGARSSWVPAIFGVALAAAAARLRRRRRS